MMSKLKYVAVASVLSFGLTACNSNSRNSATLGGSQDTTNVNKGGANTSEGKDTAKSSGTDSTRHGNADPSGHMTNDSTKKK